MWAGVGKALDNLRVAAHHYADGVQKVPHEP